MKRYYGIYTNVREDFQRKPLPGLARALKAEKHDASILIEYKP